MSAMMAVVVYGDGSPFVDPKVACSLYVNLFGGRFVPKNHYKTLVPS